MIQRKEENSKMEEEGERQGAMRRNKNVLQHSRLDSTDYKLLLWPNRAPSIEGNTETHVPRAGQNSGHTKVVYSSPLPSPMIHPKDTYFTPCKCTYHSSPAFSGRIPWFYQMLMRCYKGTTASRCCTFTWNSQGQNYGSKLISSFSLWGNQDSGWKIIPRTQICETVTKPTTRAHVSECLSPWQLKQKGLRPPEGIIETKKYITFKALSSIPINTKISKHPNALLNNSEYSISSTTLGSLSDSLFVAQSRQGAANIQIVISLSRK